MAARRWVGTLCGARWGCCTTAAPTRPPPRPPIQRQARQAAAWGFVAPAMYPAPLAKTNTRARGRACPQTHLDGVVCTGGALNLCMQTPAAGTRPVAVTIPTAGGAHSHRIHCCASHPTTSASRGPPHSTGRAAVLLSLLGAWPTPPGARVQVCLGGHTQHTNTHTPHQLPDTHTGQPRDSCVGSRGPQEG